jgi:hypothetical protein
MLALTDRVIEKIDAVAGAYHRLVILAGPCQSGKTMCLSMVHERIDAPLININLELSQKLLEWPRRQRAFEASMFVGDFVAGKETRCVLMDNIEILFHPELALDPLRLLQKLSRNRIIVATWSGVLDGGHLAYAEPWHPEYNRWPANDLAIIPIIPR